MGGNRKAVLTALCVLASSLAVGGAGATSARPAAAASVGPLESYVVVLREPAPGSADPLSVDHLSTDLLSAVTGLVTAVGGEVALTYTSAFQGFAALLPSVAVPLLRLDPRVASISRDVPVTTARVQRNPIWNLDRSDQEGRRLDNRYGYPDRAGAGAHIYVVDTGISGHDELAGRIGAGRNFVGGLLFGPDPDDWSDCNGHGTHIASTAAGTRWGIAKRATVHAVRVLGCAGGGSTSEILAGLDWVAATHQSPAVVNLSLGTSTRVAAIDAAVRGLVSRGVAVAAAAGNGGSNACAESPAGEPAVLTVGATNKADQRAGFSNLGPCVDLFAPGVDITGARAGTRADGLSLNGTSMAAPHVAGALALLRAEQPRLSARTVQERLKDAATRRTVVARGTGSPDRLLRVYADKPPKARFAVRCDGPRCTFRAARSRDDEGIRRYQWDFGAQRARGSTVTHRFRSRGRHTVVLTVTDRSGQRDTARRTLRTRR